MTVNCLLVLFIVGLYYFSAMKKSTPDCSSIYVYMLFFIFSPVYCLYFRTDGKRVIGGKDFLSLNSATVRLIAL